MSLKNEPSWEPLQVVLGLGWTFHCDLWSLELSDTAIYEP